MSFIRSKEIPPGSGNWYDYLVHTVHDGQAVIQKHVKYLGKKGTYDASVATTGAITVSHPSARAAPVSHVEDKPRIFKMKTPAKLVASAMGMYYGGMSLDAIQQLFKQDHDLDMSETNYWNWVKRFTREAIRQSKDFKPVVGDTWVADETYMKLGKKTVYFWDILDSESRYLLASHVSFHRGASDAKELMRLAKERAGKAPKRVVTDKLGSYISGVEDTFGSETEHKQGGPFKYIESGESTALIERFHRTLEQRTKVFQKYKDMGDIRLLTSGWLINYNFFKQNEGCGDIPPAQARSKVVPFKDWNDVVRPESVPDTDYRVSLYRRKSARAKTVFDATLTPMKPSGESA